MTLYITQKAEEVSLFERDRAQTITRKLARSYPSFLFTIESDPKSYPLVSIGLFHMKREGCDTNGQKAWVSEQ